MSCENLFDEYIASKFIFLQRINKKNDPKEQQRTMPRKKRRTTMINRMSRLINTYE
jgi:hypothetical protein